MCGIVHIAWCGGREVCVGKHAVTSCVSVIGHNSMLNNEKIVLHKNSCVDFGKV